MNVKDASDRTSTNQNLSIVSSTNPFETKSKLNVVQETIVELRTISMFHHSLIDFVNFSELLDSQLEEADHIRNELSRLKWESANSECRKELIETSFSTYFGFSSLSSRSIYSIADTTNYGGYLKSFEDRKRAHKSGILDALSSKEVYGNFQHVHRYMASCTTNGKSVFIEQCRKNMNKIGALFSEHTMISFICASPINQNETHGSTTEFKDILLTTKKRNGETVTKEDIVKCGCAEFVQFQQKNKFEFDLMTPIFDTKFQVAQNLSIEQQDLVFS